jgi:hypothetical protein
MPNFDLSSATLGRVANQPVDMLRIANQDVWVAEQPLVGARVRPTWTPPISNAPGEYTHGQSFNTSAPAYVLGIWWYQPAVGDVSDVVARLYLESNQSILVFSTLLAANITPGVWNFVEFASPYAISPATGYRAAVLVSGEQGYDNDGGFPHSAGPITVTADFYNSGDGYPNTDWTGAHGLDIEWAV